MAKSRFEAQRNLRERILEAVKKLAEIMVEGQALKAEEADTEYVITLLKFQITATPAITPSKN